MIHDLYAEVLGELETFSHRSSINPDEDQSRELVNSVSAIFNPRILRSIPGNASLQSIPRRFLQSPELSALSSNLLQPEAVSARGDQSGLNIPDDDFQNQDEFTNCISVDTFGDFGDENDGSLPTNLTGPNQPPQSTEKDDSGENDRNRSSRTMLHPVFRPNLPDFTVYIDESWVDYMDTTGPG